MLMYFAEAGYLYVLFAVKVSNCLVFEMNVACSILGKLGQSWAQRPRLRRIAVCWRSM